MTAPSALPSDLPALLADVGAKARASGLFAAVEELPGRLECTALASAEPASFRLDMDKSRLWVSLVTANRWLSESIESDLMHTGDKLDDLIEEELEELDFKGGTVSFEHFRSEDKLFTFRTPVTAPGEPLAGAAARALTYLLAYEACFRNLGDMNVTESED